MTREFPSYFRERLRLRLFGPVVLLLAATACWASNTLQPGACAQALGLTTLLVVQFRVWDDLADRARDRVTHPDRVLVRAAARPFVLLTLGLALTGLATAWSFGEMRPLLALAGLNATFAILYPFVRPLLHETVWRFPVLLAKYPAFVAIVAIAIGKPAPPRLAVAALLAYGAALAYEAAHSRPSLPS